MKDKDQEKLWEAYGVQREAGYPHGSSLNDPFGSSRDEFVPGVDDEPHPDALTPQDIRNEIISDLDTIEDVQELLDIQQLIKDRGRPEEIEGQFSGIDD
jgi:hypothetical protein